MLNRDHAKVDRELGIWPPEPSHEIMSARADMLYAQSLLRTLDAGHAVDTGDMRRAVDALDRAMRVHLVEREVPRLQRRIASWADDIFPSRTPDRVILKMFEEVGEVLKNPEDPEELADVLILVLDLARMEGVDIVKAAHEKMAKNESREWNVNKLGIMRHVESD